VSIDKGGSGNPSAVTAIGVLKGIQGALQYCYNSPDLEGRIVAVQGAGNVGRVLIGELLKLGAVVKVFDTQKDSIQKLFSYIAENFDNQKKLLENMLLLDKDTIIEEDCDIFSPNAAGGIINEKSILKIKAKIIAGGANNQLKDPGNDSLRLQEKGIVFLPDYLINRMGITNAANETYGYVYEEIISLADLIFDDVIKVLKRAEDEKITTTEATEKTAMETIEKGKHPIYGNDRWKKFIKLIAEDKDWLHRD